MTNAEMFIQEIVKGQGIQDANVQKHFQLIDLGFIQGYNPNGTVNVLSLYLNNGEKVIYQNAEVLYLGTREGAFTCCADGGLCLVLNPRTSMPTVDSGLINAGAEPYSFDSIKVIPVSTGIGTRLSTGFDHVGDFRISGDGGGIRVSPTSTMLTFGNSHFTLNNDGTLGTSLCSGLFNIFTDESGVLRALKYDADRIPQLMISVSQDGSYTIKKNATEAFADTDYDDLDSFNKWLWVEQYNVDGSFVKTLQQDESTPLLQHEVASDGSVTDTLTTDSGMKYALNVGDDVSIVVDGSAKSITFTTGDVTEERKDGGWSINVNGPITLESSTTDLIKIKNTASSLYKVLKDIIDVLNNGSCATAGSPAAHTITAGQFTQALTDLNSLSGD